MAQEAADRDVARHRVRVETEHRLRVEVSRYDVRLVEHTVVRRAGHACGIAQNEVLVGIAVDTEVGLEAPPCERRRQEAEIDHDAVGLGVDLVLGDVEVRIIQLRRRRLAGDLAPGAEWREVIPCVVGLGPEHEVQERTQRSLVHLIVVVIGKGHRQIGVQPGCDLGLGASRHVGPIVTAVRDDPLLPVERRAEAVVDLAIRGRAAEGEVVRLREPPPEEAIDVVVEHGSSPVRAPEVLERVEDPARLRRRPIDALQLRLGSGRFDPEAVAIPPAAAGLPSFGGDDDGAARCVDAV